MEVTDAAAVDPSGAARRARSRRRRLVVLVAIVTLLFAALLFLLTDGSPRLAAPPPPTAEQVGAARAAVGQFQAGRERGANTVIRLGPVQLAAISALASDGFSPDRLLVTANGVNLNVAGSHRLPLGRWLNASVATRGGEKGFPTANLTVGSVSFSAEASRLIFEVARWVAIVRGARLPPLDQLVRRVTVAKGVVTAVVGLPRGSGVIAQLSSEDARANPAEVRNAYCRLVGLQVAEPSGDLATQVRRAFIVAPGATATAASNRAAFVALAMLVVDPSVGDLVDVAPKMIAKCRIPPISALLNGRADLSKHWTLSAALAVATGTQFTQAIGEWKELADSISRQSQFAEGDPSGFSFIDLATDRAGFLIAGRAVEPETAAGVGASLALAQPYDLLPPAMMRLEEGASSTAFARKYGTTTDPRFLAALAKIDAELHRSAAARSGPLAVSP